MTREQWDDLYAAYRAIWPEAARFGADTSGAWFESGMHRLDHQAAGTALMSLAQDASRAPGLANWIAATHAAAVAAQPARSDTYGRQAASKEWRARWFVIHRRILRTAASDAVRGRFIEWQHQAAGERIPADMLLADLEKLNEQPELPQERRMIGAWK